MTKRRGTTFPPGATVKTLAEIEAMTSPPAATKSESGTVCKTCNDTHKMLFRDDGGDSHEVMCTRCPTPCQRCRAGGNGAYCGTTPCGCSCHGTKKSELGTVTHDQARRAAASMLHPPSYQTLIDYISQNRERDAKLEEAYAQLRARHTRIAELEGVQRDIMAQRNAVTAQRDALLAALVKHLPLLDGLSRSLPEGPIRDVIALWLADLDAAINAAGEPVVANSATTDKRDGRIERLRAALASAADFLLPLNDEGAAQRILEEALAADGGAVVINETRIARAAGHKYTYRVVSSNGAGIYGPDYQTLRIARGAAGRLAESRSAIPGTVFEIERLLTLPGGGHRYWMMRGSRWVLWNPMEDIDARKPAFSVRSWRQ